jgi:peptide/nickel transport system substrate-binding protein
MEHRFGPKDGVFLVLLLGIGFLTLNAMWQKDRMWEYLRSIEEEVKATRTRLESVALDAKEASEVSGRLAALESALSQGATVERPAGVAPTPARDPNELPAWARPNVTIVWQPEYEYATDPRSQPGFAEGGELVEIMDARFPRVTPFINVDVYGRRIIDRVAEQLAVFDPKTLELRGLLADAWQYSPDGTWLRVHLNPKAVFSDGAPVTSEDVRYTFLDYILNPLIEAPAARSGLDYLADVLVVDAKTVEFRFHADKVLFLNLSNTLNQNILPKHYYSQFEPSQINSGTSLLMGSGPFRLQSNDPTRQWNPGEDLVLVRNERYWATNARTPLSGLRFKSITDETARLVAYRNGEGHYTTPTSPQFVEVQKEPGWNDANHSLNWINMRGGYSFIAWQCGPRAGKRLTPFVDKRVRQAMTLLIDRERMIREIWNGVGGVSKGPFNPQSPAADATNAPWPYDLERAKALLAEAGWKDGDGDGILENSKGEPFEFEATMPSGGDLYDRIGSFMKSACLKAGIRCSIRQVDWAVYTEVGKARDFDALFLGWQTNAPESDVRQMFHSDSIKAGGDNFVQWSSADADRLIDLGRRTLDQAERMKVWHQLERELHDEQPYTFIRVSPWIRFVKRTVGNVHAYKTSLEPWELFLFAGGAASQPTPGS